MEGRVPAEGHSLDFHPRPHWKQASPVISFPDHLIFVPELNQCNVQLVVGMRRMRRKIRNFGVFICFCVKFYVVKMHAIITMELVGHLILIWDPVDEWRRKHLSRPLVLGCSIAHSLLQPNDFRQVTSYIKKKKKWFPKWERPFTISVWKLNRSVLFVLYFDQDRDLSSLIFKSAFQDQVKHISFIRQQFTTKVAWLLLMCRSGLEQIKIFSHRSTETPHSSMSKPETSACRWATWTSWTGTEKR